MNVLRDLPPLVAVADELHFGRAASRLNISQPQLSAIIRRVEARCGVTVFHRRPRVRLTPEGEALVDSARRALRETEGGVARARAIAGGLAGIIRFGFAPVSILTGIAGVLEEFRRDHPDIGLQLVERHSAHLWEDLREGRLDLIVSRQCGADAEIRCVEIIRTPLLLALPNRHPLAAGGRVSLRDLRDESFIFWGRDSAPQYHDRVLAACRATGLVPVIGQVVDGWSAILSLVAARFGIALVSAPLGGIGFPGICFRPIEEPMPAASFWLSWNASGENAGARRLRARLLDWGGSLSADSAVA